MLHFLSVDGVNVIDVQVELGGLLGNALWDAAQLGVAAPHDSAGAGARRRAVIFAQAANVILARALKVVLR